MKYFVLIFALIISFTCAFGQTYTPNYINPQTYYGRGLVSIDGVVRIYENDDENSSVIGIIDGEKIKIKGLGNSGIENTFLVFNKDFNIALLPVKEDNDEWLLVCFEQSRKLFGWIKKSDYTDYMSWQDFFNVYGRKNGIVFFRNLKDAHKKLYSAPNSNSTLVDTFNFPKHASLWLISGDWMLVKITTYEGGTKTGWMRWRLNDGSVVVFPDLR